MKILIYINKEKDPNGSWQKNLIDICNEKKIDFELISDTDLGKKTSADCIFVLGGDGTILGLTQFAINSDIPIVGFNAGKLGFLTEFEKSEINEALTLLSEKKLINDYRSILSIKVKGKNYLALNDLALERINSFDNTSNIVRISVKIDGEDVEYFRGDGVLVATPTGSTAYSLSAGGSILAPRINAFILTPIAAHSLSNRPIIYSADSVCEIELLSSNNVGIFVDGVCVGKLDQNDKIIVTKCEKPTLFLRKKDFNFYNRLRSKLKREGD